MQVFPRAYCATTRRALSCCAAASSPSSQLPTNLQSLFISQHSGPEQSPKTIPYLTHQRRLFSKSSKIFAIALFSGYAAAYPELAQNLLTRIQIRVRVVRSTQQ